MLTNQHGLPLPRAYPRAFLARNMPFGRRQNKNGSPDKARKPFESQVGSSLLMRALRKQRNQNHQIRECEQPLVRAQSRGFRGARDEAQMATLRKIVHMLDADAREAGNF